MGDVPENEHSFKREEDNLSAAEKCPRALSEVCGLGESGLRGHGRGRTPWESREVRKGTAARFCGETRREERRGDGVGGCRPRAGSGPGAAHYLPCSVPGGAASQPHTWFLSQPPGRSRAPQSGLRPWAPATPTGAEKSCLQRGFGHPV